MAGTSEILRAVWGVPSVPAGGPGQRGGEGVEEKIEPPNQDHDVVSVTEEHNHHRGQAQTWGRRDEPPGGEMAT